MSDSNKLKDLENHISELETTNKLLRKRLNDEVEKRTKYESALIDIQNRCLGVIELPFTDTDDMEE